MEWKLIHAEMTRTDEDGFVGKVQFEVPGHKKPYEIALQSKKGKDWAYGLFFLNEAGPEEEIEQVEEELEEDDELYEALIEAARSTYAAEG
ncbi:hypothetical protein ACTHPH_02635 [Paenibacillus pasadenensis]|uniref:hypothetical protein n=1 Tax=Paenibacillus TaxID=44249 RepID=UPI000415A684|nr:MULTISPECIES: hypothetical protein [Paenibacillus]QGG56543.1 hypothetical protein GE073_13775 [Paenibacillus sp. B01]